MSQYQDARLKKHTATLQKSKMVTTHRRAPPTSFNYLCNTTHRRRRRRRSCLVSSIMHFHPSNRRLFNIIDIINM